MWNYRLSTIDYEALVGDIDTAIKRLGEYTGLTHLGLDSADAMSGSIHTASVWQARQAIHSQSVNRWANYQTGLADLIARHPDLFG